ncbi:MAG TPA: hypothetical protein VF587_12650, partial [Solirubrobacteraceae bacterium]
MRPAVLFAIALALAAAAPASASASERTGRLLVSLAPSSSPVAFAAARSDLRVPELGLVRVAP